MRRGHIALLTAICALGAGGGAAGYTPGDAITIKPVAAGPDLSAPAATSRGGKARPSAYANSAAKKRRRRRTRGW